MYSKVDVSSSIAIRPSPHITSVVIGMFDFVLATSLLIDAVLRNLIREYSP